MLNIGFNSFTDGPSCMVMLNYRREMHCREATVGCPFMLVLTPKLPPKMAVKDLNIWPKTTHVSKVAVLIRKTLHTRPLEFGTCMQEKRIRISFCVFPACCWWCPRMLLLTSTASTSYAHFNWVVAVHLLVMVGNVGCIAIMPGETHCFLASLSETPTWSSLSLN